MKEEPKQESRWLPRTFSDLLGAARHKIAHFFGWNTGEIQTWWEGGRLKVGFRCHGCRQLSGVELVPDYTVYPEKP